MKSNLDNQTRVHRGIVSYVVLLTFLLAAAMMMGCSRERSPDILLITIDTLRADHLGCYGFDGAQTPHIDALAANGVRYAECSAPAPMTLPSHTTILTGRTPPHHGVRNNGSYRLPDHVPTLAEGLRERGYATAAFIAAFPLVARYGLNRGFDEYDDQLPNTNPGGFHFRERSGREVVARAVEWLAQQPSDHPTFTWVHLFEPHRPYLPPPPFDQAFADRPYDGEVAAADAAVGWLLERLPGLGRDNVLVVLTSDHGEGLGEHGEDTHGLFLYESTLHVPLIVQWVGGFPSGRVVEQPVGLVDLAPSILAWIGADSGLIGGDANIQGYALDPSAEAPTTQAPPDRPLYAENLFPWENYGWSPSFAQRQGSHKVVRSRHALVFDLATDPSEQNNLASRRPQWAAGMFEAIDHSIGHGERASLDARVTPSDEERRALDALGYVSNSNQDRPTTAQELMTALINAPDPADRREEFANMTRATDALARNQPELALQYLDRLIALDSANAFAHMARGEALRAMSRREEALRAYTEAIRLRPSWFEVQVDIARMHRGLGRPDEAQAAYARALTLDPDSVPLRLESADLAARRGQTQVAVDLIQAGLKSTQLEPNDRAQLHVGLGGLYLDQHEAEKAQAQLEAAEAQSDEPGIAILRARLLEANGDAAGARDVLEAALPSLQGTAAGRACFELGELNRLDGELDAALPWYEQATRHDDNLSLAHNNAAWLLATRGGDAGEALRHADRAIALNPGHADYYDTLIEALIYAGYQTRAKEVTAGALARFPQNEDLRRRAQQVGLPLPR